MCNHRYINVYKILDQFTWLGSNCAARATAIAPHLPTYCNTTTQRHTEYCHLWTENYIFLMNKKLQYLDSAVWSVSCNRWSDKPVSSALPILHKWDLRSDTIRKLKITEHGDELHAQMITNESTECAPSQVTGRTEITRNTVHNLDQKH